MTLPCPKIKYMMGRWMMHKWKNIKKTSIHYPLSIIHKSGFTFIELLVGVGILGIITTIGVASYNNFNDQRVVEKAAEELKTNLRLAQSKAMNNEKDTTCTSALIGWGIKQITDNFHYQIYYDCGGGTIYYQNPIGLESDLTFSPNFDVFFKTLGGTTLATDQEITIEKSLTITRRVTVNIAGDIK